MATWGASECCERGRRFADEVVDVRHLKGISFVVVTYNSRKTIGECIASILAQDARPIEIFVVDNASADGTPDFVDAKFPSTTVMRNDVNTGFGSASNSGGRAAHADIVAFVNPDVALGPKWSTEVVRVIGSNRGCAAAEGKLLLADEPGLINCAGSSINLLGFGCMTHYGETALAAAKEKLVGYASGAAFAIRRDLFLRLGGFDESYFLYQEDVDLGLRVYEAGWQIRYAPSAVAYHHYKSDLSDSKVRHLEKNRWKTLAKHMPIKYFFLCGPLIAASELGLIADLFSTGLLPSKIKAALDFFRDLPQTLKARRIIRNAAEVPDVALQLMTDDFPAIIRRTEYSRELGKRLISTYHSAFLRRYAQAWTYGAELHDP